ncbi:hypothetical protein BO83DRAFT_336834 [Aspergillus eucalypticola CBS 122712]|uniref:DUF7924 domain-containing protein n=1 Tax=Aspergillus eucalypticola (strain CBS 122712 / IBT 29274) TaxID=1448314 RepID=A0A317VLV1_ASPEC|nr:uncharacterized protein BO83DRAFT_336834 [Aspergillus eucalypticola CBS 122712]PWY73918.1 hypothetical protein BO83DRAFT_336834 [Aspergillus eucalypticola CBS 122712]
MTQMKRPCSPTPLPSKRVSTTACLTTDALKEHDRNTRPVSLITRLDMASEQSTSGIPGEIPILSPSTRSSQRSRSSSPSRLSDAQYRYRLLRRANIFVDDEIPMDIRHHTENQVFNILLDNNDSNLHKVSEKLWHKSKELVRKPSGEAEWTEALYTAIDELKPDGLEVARNRDWREDLKPPVYNPLSTVPRKRDRSHRIVPGNTVEPTIPIFKLKDPRPDICVGLSDENLANALVPKKGRSAARRFLVDLQETSSLISDPHVTPLGLRFPFLVVEAKAAATGGNLYQAQNQAAVGGSAALQILKNLLDLQDLDEEDQEVTEDGPVVAQDLPNTKLRLAFSVTTEGPIHELWLHFQKPREEDFYMVCLGTWRTTLKDGSLNFLRQLSAVLRWGNGELKDDIISVLQDI